MRRLNANALVAGLFLLSFQATLQAQTIDYFTPEFGQVEQYVTVYGSGFYYGVGNVINPVNQAWFNNTPATYLYVNSDIQLTLKVPVGATTGPIALKRASGSQVFSTKDFTVIGPYPYIDTFSPTKGPGGTLVTINGTQFQNNVTAVKFNGITGIDLFVQGDTSLTVKTPANVTTGPITIVGDNGTGSYTTSNKFYAPPVINGFSPSKGRVGDQLTINGINFTDTTDVLIGNVHLPVFNVNGNTQVVATIPSGTVSGKVIVWTPGGQYQTSTNFTMLPSISGFTPPLGKAGTNVTISGANLNVAPVSVNFNGVAATILSTNFTQIVAVAPASSSGPIMVTTADGSATSSATFYYPPVIDSLDPGFGGGGTGVNINGNSFTDTSSVTFDGTPAASFVVSNNTLIRAVAPTNVSTGPVVVTAPGGAAVSPGLFYGPAQFSGFLPAQGFPGTDVLLFGENFEGATAVAFNGTSAPIIGNTGTQISTKVPTNATTGLITVTTPAGTVSSFSPFVVPGACDLRVNTFLHAPNPVTAGNDLTLTIVPSNDGPDTASNVTASVTLGPGVLLKSASSPFTYVTVNTNGDPVVFSMVSMSVSQNPTLTVVLEPLDSGPLTNTVTLASSTFDSNPGNNTDTRVTTVLPVPELSIDLIPAGQARIAWPVELTNYILQFTPALTNNPPWSNVLTAPVIQGSERVVTEPATNSAKYYRLKK